VRTVRLLAAVLAIASLAAAPAQAAGPIEINLAPSADAPKPAAAPARHPAPGALPPKPATPVATPPVVRAPAPPKAPIVRAAPPAAPVAPAPVPVAPVVAVAPAAPSPIPAGLFGPPTPPPALPPAVQHIDSFTRDFKVPEPDSIQPTISFPFNARVDRSLISAQVRLLFTPPTAHSDLIRAIKVFVNQEEIGSLMWEDLMHHHEARTLTVPPKLLGDRNTLMLKMIADGGGLCGEVPEGVWRSARVIQVLTDAATVEMPNELALLPLPFVDRDFDRNGSLTFVLPTAKTGSTLELAGIVAGWFGTAAAQDLVFPVRIGELPESSAVVFVDSLQTATTLGLPAPEGPMVRMLDNPKFPNQNFKILMVAGQTPEELALAVHGFAAQAVPLEGDVVRYKEPPPAHPSQPYDAPWWIASGKAVSFEQYPQTPYEGSPNFALPGGRDGTIAVRFRAAPDLWTWPTEFVDLDLGYSVELAPGGSPPRLDVEFNNNFIATLPPLDAVNGETNGRVNLRVRAEQIRGFNELQLHVRYPRLAGECEARPDEQSKVSLSADSSLHTEAFDHFANLPNVGMFVHDGYPFTRVADLGETAIVLPSEPKPQEIATFLSFMAHFGTITGRVGDRVQLMTAEQLMETPSLDKDLLLVGTMEDHPAMRRWSARLPLSMGPSSARAQLPSESNPILALWNNARAYFDLQRLKGVLFRERRFTAVMGLVSPLSPHRSALVVTASTVPLMPSVDKLIGVLETRSRSGDLLIASGVQRWMFQIGPVYGEGHLSDWTAFRRFFAMQFVLLFPGLILGAILIAIQLEVGMIRRIKRRLGQDGKS
jgi:hypothetical protein